MSGNLGRAFANHLAVSSVQSHDNSNKLTKAKKDLEFWT